MEKKIELLAPAGTKEAFYSALHAGCDAIYLGGKSFSARAFADNFNEEEIKELIAYAHIRDVKVYVTVNTLIFDDEMENALKWIDFLYHHDVDAILLQDLGLASRVHTRYPTLPIHASTQINCHNVEIAKKLIEIGFSRIVVARETPLSIIQEIKKLNIEVEVFIHGALCVSYSGNCLMSSFIGKRSGNRGRCAQPCRMKNSIVGKDGAKGNYAISTKELETLAYIHQLKELGIDSLKIEGRMKRDEYVYEVVSTYRYVLDHFTTPEQIEQKRKDLAKLYNRDFTKGYLFGASRLEVLNQNTSNHQGIFLGIVQNVHGNFVYVRLEESLSIGDGIRFDNKKEEGMIITSMSVGKEKVTHAEKGKTVSFARHDREVKPGMRVMKTTDNAQLNLIKEKEKIEKKIPIRGVFQVREDYFFSLIITDNHGNSVESISSLPAEKAQKTATNPERIHSQIAKLSDYPYSFIELSILMNEDLFIPISEINRIRRDCLEQLNNTRKKWYIREDALEDKTNILLYTPKPFSYLIQVETEEQLLLALSYSFIDSIFISQINLYKKYQNDPRVKYNLPRIQSKNYLIEKKALSHYIHESKQNILSPYGNVTNSDSLLFYLNNGYSGVILSYECSGKDIKKIADKTHLIDTFLPVFVPIYGRMDLMIMESCPIATSRDMKKDHCMLCKSDSYYLKDRMQSLFPLLSTPDCQIRLLHEKPLSLLSEISSIRELGYQGVFLTFTVEKPTEMRCVLNELQKVSTGDKPSDIPFPTTSGHFYKGIQ